MFHFVLTQHGEGTEVPVHVFPDEQAACQWARDTVNEWHDPSEEAMSEEVHAHENVPGARVWTLYVGDQPQMSVYGPLTVGGPL